MNEKMKAAYFQRNQVSGPGFYGFEVFQILLELIFRWRSQNNFT